MSSTRINHSKLAESELQRLCDLHNIPRNKAFDDQTGWDYLLEFPRTRLTGVAHDRQVGNSTARVQVKSTKTDKPQTRFKLTNALHFTRESDICFVLLFHFAGGQAPFRVYARHFSAELMEIALRAAREADRDGRDDLHRIFVPIAFSDTDDHTDDLIPWMSALCDQAPEIYAVQKRQWESRLGYETVAASTSLTFDHDQLQPMIDSSAGLGGAVPVRYALVQDVRFGIPGKTPIFEGEGSTVDITVHPQPARLLVEDVTGSKVAFQGDFRLGLPVAEREMMRASFIAPCLRLVIKGFEDFELNFSFQPDEAYAVADLDNICRFQKAARTGASVDLEVDGATVLSVSCPPQTVASNQRLDHIGVVAAALLKASPAAASAVVSMTQLSESWEDAVFFTEMLTDDDMTFKCQLDQMVARVPQIRNYVGYVSVQVGNFFFWAIIRRPCLEQEDKDGALKLVFGDPIILDGGVESASAAFTREALEQRVVSWTQRVGHGTLTLNEGNPFLAKPDEALRALFN